MAYPLEQLFEEVGYLAYHFHWSEHEIMGLEHGDRRRWVAQVSAINDRVNNA